MTAWVTLQSGFLIVSVRRRTVVKVAAAVPRARGPLRDVCYTQAAALKPDTYSQPAELVLESGLLHTTARSMLREVYATLTIAKE